MESSDPAEEASAAGAAAAASVAEAHPLPRRPRGPVLPTEPLVRLLLQAGAEPEWLLAEAAAAPSEAFARVLLERGLATGLVRLGEGRRSARDVGLVSPLPAMVDLFRPLSAFLGRYEVDGGPPVHISETCKVVLARDLGSGGQQRYLAR